MFPAPLFLKIMISSNIRNISFRKIAIPLVLKSIEKCNGVLKLHEWIFSHWGAVEFLNRRTTWAKCMADPATFLASNSENSLFIHIW